MKKCLLLIALFLGLQANFAQESQTFCAYEVVEGLRFCLMGKGAQFTIVYTGSNNIYIVGRGNQPTGKLNTCIAQYNTNSYDCEDAPVIVDNPYIRL